MTLFQHLWICYYYLVISLSCGIHCNCVKHNYSASDLEGNVITEQQDSYDIECHMYIVPVKLYISMVSCDANFRVESVKLT